MHFAIDTADARPIYVQIMDEVRRALVMGALRPEDPLPSVRQLAADLRLNPNTVAQAYRELERDGIVYVRRGQGTFIADRATPDAERAALIAEVARRALVDAHRHGLSADDLIQAIRDAAAADAKTAAE
ncbi:GntR family transcriptional regulator [Caulobacter sp. SLTY]|uniref:GntR family transcriptional regulator n=1 Tax=Caulobacter sp. SLTY TaxID=2683262 RepID=UPI0014124873|nr:GntR family transcriptional regulator [Caulobacter sp. SLTY]